MPEETSCPACSHREASPREHLRTPADVGPEIAEGFSLWCCSHCRSEFALPRRVMNYETIPAGWQVYEQFVEPDGNVGRLHHMRSATSHFRDSPLVYQVMRLLGPGGHFVDFAAGSGYMTEAARELGFETHAVDLSADFRAFIRKTIPGATVYESIPEFLDTGVRARVVLASHIIEHLESPLEALEMLGQALTPEGLLIVVVPNVDRSYYRFGERGSELESIGPVDFPPHHLTRFSRDGLDILLERTGFAQRALAYAPASLWDLFHLGLGDPEFDFWSYFEDPVRMAEIARTEKNLDQMLLRLGLDDLGWSIVALASNNWPKGGLSALLEDARAGLFRNYGEATLARLSEHNRSRVQLEGTRVAALASAEDLRRALDEKESHLDTLAKEAARAYAAKDTCIEDLLRSLDSKDTYIESLQRTLEAKEAYLGELQRALADQGDPRTDDTPAEPPAS